MHIICGLYGRGNFLHYIYVCKHISKIMNIIHIILRVGVYTVSIKNLVGAHYAARCRYYYYS